jgi:hypothetical protein
MKVAVSIPDPVFHEAERVSRKLRVPRSRLYSRAVEAFIRPHSGSAVTAKLNTVLAKLGSDLDPGWEAPGLEVGQREKW